MHKILFPISISKFLTAKTKQSIKYFINDPRISITPLGEFEIIISFSPKRANSVFANFRFKKTNDGLFIVTRFELFNPVPSGTIFLIPDCSEQTIASEEKEHRRNFYNWQKSLQKKHTSFGEVRVTQSLWNDKIFFNI